jgi:hypothetical protein
MSEIYRNLPKVFLALLIASVILPSNRAAAAVCQNLPPSKLLIYNIQAPRLEEEKVPAAKLDQQMPPNGLASMHTMMLTMSNLISLFDIHHRPVAGSDGTVCDAPEFVRIGLGSSQRKILFMDMAADDACVRRQMLEHEAAHTQAFDSTVNRFIDDTKTDFERGMKTLKQTPASSAELAKTRWEEGLRLILTEAKQQLLTDLRAASAGVDDPAALTALETACNGKIRELEQHSSANP